MKIKKYLLYLLVLIVAGVIVVSIYYAIRDKNDADIPAVSQSDTVTDADPGEEKDGGTTEGNNEKTVKVENYYSSTSAEFKKYGFICPEGWTLAEEDGGSRVVLAKIQKDPYHAET
ncbi:MAG: hypothetical protein MUO59_04185, partial [Actinobacteria bacterium]|nr:hypothetical protein [Actinomycetota bacterium]